jgi:hypothetical protein
VLHQGGFSYVPRARRVGVGENGYKFAAPDLLHFVARAIAMYPQRAGKGFQSSLGRLAVRAQRNALQIVDFERQHAEGLSFAVAISPRRIQQLLELAFARRAGGPCVLFGL